MRGKAKESSSTSMSRTPVPQDGRRSRQRRLYADTDVAEMVTMQLFYRPESPRSKTAYQPNDSLYEGDYRPLADLSDEEQENRYPALASSSRYNVFQGQRYSRKPPACEGPSSAEIITLLQEQQQLLHQVLETQVSMKLKQDEFERKLQELAKCSESSSSSPDVRGKNKCRIRRDLSVSSSFAMVKYVCTSFPKLYTDYCFLLVQ